MTSVPRFIPVDHNLRAFLDVNPGLDFEKTDFYDPEVVAGLQFGASEQDGILEAARAHQSLVRVTDDPELVERLFKAGLHSAAAISRLSPEKLHETLGAVDGAELATDDVAAVHAQAVDRHTRAVHMFTQMLGSLSPYAQSARGNHVAEQLAAAFGHLPSFTDLFGSQDFIASPQCQSVIGPAAYFLDLMRIIDHEITNNPANDIPPDTRLDARREWLFTLDLTCANTTTPVPKIQFANQAIHDQLAKLVGPDTDYALATRAFPYNLPVNVRLEQTRAALSALGSSLSELYRTFQGRVTRAAALPDAAALSAEELGLSAEQQALVTTVRAGADLAACFGGDAALLAQPKSAKVTIAKDALTVTGTGFTTTASPGTILRVGDTLRAVVTVNSDTELSVDQSWPQALTNADGVFYAPGSLSQASILATRTRLKDTAVAALFTGGLSPVEQKAGLAAKLFINSGSTLPPAAFISDGSDVSYTLQVIDSLDEGRLDRLNRILRLSLVSQVAVADLDWALAAAGNGALDTAGLTAAGAAVALARRLKLPVDEACALWSPMKTWGRGTDERPQDLFDRVFNAAAVAEGTGYYRPLYAANPTFTDPVKTWTLNDQGADAQATRTWLSSALGISDKDLGLVGAWVADGAAALQLDVPTLTKLWAPARLARALGTSIADLLAEMRLMGLKNCGCPADVTKLVELNTLLTDRSLALTDLAYIVWGEPGELSGVVKTKDIEPFLAALRTQAADWLLTPASFSNDGASNDGAKIFDSLQWGALINAAGLVLVPEWRLSFPQVSLCFPLSAGSLVVPGVVDMDEAIDAFNELSISPLMMGNVLAVPVDASTDLSFLFTDETSEDKRRDMIAAVRKVLNILSHRIQLSVDVLVPALRLQKEGTWEQLATLYATSAAIAQVVVVDALGKAFPGKNPLDLLLTGAATSDALTSPLLTAGRVIHLAKLLALTAEDLSDAANAPSAFGLASIEDLRWEAVRSWSDYSTLVAQFEPRREDGRHIAEYLRTGSVAALCTATKWDAAAFSALVASAWGSALTLTPTPLMEARACFSLASRMGTDLGTCVTIAGLSRLAAMSGDTPPAAWATYKWAADTLMGTLKAKSAGGDWQSASKPVRDREETARRDGGVPLTVWLLSSKPLGITTERQLSEYLLIDLQTSAVDVSSPIVEATSAAQMYLQRCHMSLEAGVVSLGNIAEAWWPWLTNYQVWAANRKIFLYPEDYIDPALRQDRTDLFRKLQEELQQTDITPGSVERAYTNYLTSFAELAKLRTVDCYKAKAPHPVSGAEVQTTFFLGRTESKPYQYYVRSLRDGNMWSQWSKVDVAMSPPEATIIFAYNRLFLFWVEVEAVKGSYIKDGSQKDKVVHRATIRYAFQRLDGTWSAPQTLRSDVLFDVQPTTYTNNVINTDPKAASFDGIDPSMAYWRRVFVQMVPGKTDRDERILVLFGNAFRVPNKPDVPAPDKAAIQTAEELEFVSQVYTMSQAGKLLTGTQGSVTLVPASFLDISMEVEHSAVFLPDFAGEHLPFSYGRWHSDFGLIDSRNIIEDCAFADAGDYFKRQPNSPYDLITNVSADARLLAISNQMGWFVLDNGDEAFVMVPQQVDLKLVEDILDLTTQDLKVKTIDGADQTLTCLLANCGDYSTKPVDPQRLVVKFVRMTTSAVDRLVRLMTYGGVEELLSIKTQQAPGPAALEFSRFYPDGTQPFNVVAPEVQNGGCVDFWGAYRPYYEEIFFHAPFFIATQLNAAQRFADAKRWYDFIFDPAAMSKEEKPPAGNPNSIYWQYLPFRSLDAGSLIDWLTDQTAIEAWNANPFDPFTVAQLRPVAFEKTIVMHYVANLLDWADSCFTLDTRESVNQATLLYMMAADLLGPRPRERGVYKPPAPLNFKEIREDYTGGKLIPQFLIELERVLPKPQPGALPLEPAPFNVISAYFTVPENSEFIAYWDRVESNLYKIRNGLSISGIPRQLPLFEPPIDPRRLMRSGPTGGDFPAVVNQGAGSLPNYRFQVMLERAKQVAGQVASFGTALLSALEKQDAEQLQMLRTRQERAMLVQTGDMKAQLLLEAQDQLVAQREASKAANERLSHYSKLIQDGLSPAEITSLTTMILANVFQTSGGVINALSGAAHLVPNVGSPFAMTYGGREIGSSLAAFGTVMETVAGTLNFASTLSGVIAGYERRAQEWTLQKNTAVYEVAQMDATIKAAEAHVAALKRDAAMNTLSISQSDETEKALTGKFTNADLYGWLSARLSALHFQAYKLALDLAMAAQRAFQYELDSDARYLDYGYWDAGRRGLLAGEGLSLALSQLEHAYYTTNKRRLTIEKTISLWQLDPQALLTLRRTGSCTFNLSELLFDYDFPGHYCRKIESVSVTIPMVVGPYQNVHGTLTQTGNVVLVKADDNTVKYLLGKEVTPLDAALRMNWRAGQQIALSRGTDDGALTGADDGRYGTFEGTGAVSSWRLDLPMGSNRIDYGTIADVVITLTYSALNGGDAFRSTVNGAISKAYDGQVMLPLNQRYPDAWNRFLHPAKDQPQTLSFAVGKEALPANITGPQATKAYVQFDFADGVKTTFAATLTPPAGKAVQLSISEKSPWGSGPVSCPLDGKTWTLSVGPLAQPLTAATVKSATLVLDYSATVERN